jgi:hypothetical protein
MTKTLTKTDLVHFTGCAPACNFDPGLGVIGVQF